MRPTTMLYMQLTNITSYSGNLLKKPPRMGNESTNDDTIRARL